MSPRRISSSQIRSQMRQAQRQAQRKVDQQMRQAQRKAEQQVKQATKEFERDVNRELNKMVSQHNTRARTNQQRYLRELRRLNSRATTTTRYATYGTSVQTVHRSFSRIEEASTRGGWTGSDELFDLIEGEAANSAATLNVLLDGATAVVVDIDELRQTVITDELSNISMDLHRRWRGALFALNPDNDDAARHFCTSSREVVVKLLNILAPDDAVKAGNSDIELVNGQVPRREKIYFLLKKSGQQSDELADFIEADINNVMDLFKDFNSGTHEEAGRFTLTELAAIKTRVEGAIQFLHRIATY